jgi:hypothetical protein
LIYEDINSCSGCRVTPNSRPLFTHIVEKPRVEREYDDIVATFFPRLKDKLPELTDDLYMELARAARQLAGCPKPDEVPYTKYFDVYGMRGCAAEYEAVPAECSLSPETFHIQLDLLCTSTPDGEADDICDYIGAVLMGSPIVLPQIKAAEAYIRYGGILTSAGSYVYEPLENSEAADVIADTCILGYASGCPVTVCLFTSVTGEPELVAEAYATFPSPNSAYVTVGYMNLAPS